MGVWSVGRGLGLSWGIWTFLSWLLVCGVVGGATGEATLPPRSASGRGLGAETKVDLELFDVVDVDTADGDRCGYLLLVLD